MKRLLLTAFATIYVATLLSSCNTVTVEEGKITTYVCNCAQKDSVKQFLYRLTKDANNKSDEEMEDVIRELTRAAVHFNCQQRISLITSSGTIYTSLDSSNCESVYRFP